ncbi:DUF6452 family protein [Prevotella sp. E13-27]|uniref:DUF6452 family protein n=1 Tax=Prevotella sp. E13-27 TaxID=2938122 RepID=UPI00200A3244|nr:DUF6452 family protein [Prevotella sp. E13-27]MCK8622830.1 DUF6452 family protein [Prevotella sp. E13-27]
MKLKKLKKLMKLKGLAVLLVICAVACTSIECPVQNRVLSVYAVEDTLKDTLTILTTRKNRKDTILLNSSQNTTKFSLPMSYQNSVDTLIFKTTRLVATDTVWVEKTNMAHFESVDCGMSYFHDIKSVRSTHVGIDTITITKSFVDYDNKTSHLSIRFKSRN